MSTDTAQILVIEDDLDIGLMIRMMLEQQGYSVNVIDKAEQVEQLLQQRSFDLIIMDMLLSGNNGLDICLQLKQDSKLSRIPILMTSAYPNAQELATNAGAEDFISKPFELNDILSKIRNLLGKNSH